MLKRNKLKLLLSSLVILLPMLVGLLLWDRLPQQMATHWGISGAADGWSGRVFAVFALPVFLLIIHWVCLLVTAADPKNKNQTRKVMGLVFWICPLISLFSNAMVYAAAFGMSFGSDVIMLALMGLMFVVIGNYLPKCKQNFTLGIKVKWALQDEENWNATHRLGGKVWVVGGILLMLCVFLPRTVIPYAIIVILPVLALIPVIYSYWYHRKHGTASVPIVMSKTQKRITQIALGIAAIILLGVGYLLFSGNINMAYGDTSFTVTASYWENLTVNYDAIEDITYLEQSVSGSRTFGFGSPRLQMGTYQNEEYGSYTRYTYTGCDACVVLTVDGKTLVLSGKDAGATKVIYETLRTKIS